MKLVERYRSANYLPEDANLFSTWFQQTYGEGTKENILPTFQSYVDRGYAGNGVVFSVILARAMLLSEATFKFRDQSTKKLFGSQALLPLEKPWPNGTTGELIIRMEQDASLAGNAFIREDADRLVRLRPDWVSIVLNPSGAGEDRSRWDVVGYTYQTNGPSSPVEFYTVDEVAHWSPIPDPVAEYRGMSWLTPVVREINSDIAMTEYKRRFMDNSATPNLLIKYASALTPDAMSKVRETWNARYGGPEGLKTAVLDNGADVTVIGNSFAAMDFTKVQGAGETRIASAGGVPAIVVGLKEGMDAATYSNYAQAMRRFADLTCRPLWRSLCATLSQVVDIPTGAELWYDTSDIAALHAGEQEQATTMQLYATAMADWVRFGYEPQSVVDAIVSGDVGQLVHSGQGFDVVTAVPKASPAPLVLQPPPAASNIATPDTTTPDPGKG